MRPHVSRLALSKPDRSRRWISFKEWGDRRARRAVVCVHGLTRNARDFDFLAQALSPNVRVIAPDIAGRGESEWLQNPAEYHYGTYATDMIALLDHLGIHRCQWVGTSMGGIIGMTIAAMQPSLISALVLNDIGATVAKEGLARIASYAGVTRFTDRLSAEAKLRAAYQSFGIQDAMHWNHLFTHSLKENKGELYLDYDPHILSAYKEQTENFTKIDDIDLSQLWQAVTCPTLVLRGEHSDILRKETVEQMCEKPGVSSVSFDGIGHAPSLYRAQEISVIIDWLAQQA